MNPLLVPPTTAAEILGIGKSLFYQLASSGALGPRPVILGTKKLYRVAELQDWVTQSCPTREQWAEMQKNKHDREGGGHE